MTGTPTGTVALFRLPLALDSMNTITECIERVYGTGNMLMRGDGDQIEIAAPREGWGPRKRGRGALPTASNDQMRLRYLDIRDGRVTVTVEDAEYAVLLISEIAKSWFNIVGGINYVETKLSTESGGEPEFIFTMQRAEGLSPHDKVTEAEARIRELEAELDALRKDAGQ